MSRAATRSSTDHNHHPHHHHQDHDGHSTASSTAMISMDTTTTAAAAAATSSKHHHHHHHPHAGGGGAAAATKTNPSHPNVLISRLDDTLEPWQWNHRAELDEVKRRSGIAHNLLDQWIWKFLENKHFDVNETVAKLERRLTMERNELGTYEVSDLMRETMKSGLMQCIGQDKAGRVALYVVTARDFPKSKHRQMRTQNFDMWLSWACRIRARNASCGITMLINQTDASFWSNTDMTFQSNIALRIAKYYPGVIDRAYVCNMSTTLSTIAKPILSAFPKAISDHIFVISKDEVKNGKLLEYFEDDVLPVVMGGKNANIDTPQQFQDFSDRVEEHYAVIKQVIQSGKSLKEWEMEQALEECAKIDDEEKRKFRNSSSSANNPNINNNNEITGVNEMEQQDDDEQQQEHGGENSASRRGRRYQQRQHRRRESQESGTSTSRFQNNNNNNNLMMITSSNLMKFQRHHHENSPDNYLQYNNNNNDEEYQEGEGNEAVDEDNSELYTCASSDVDLDALIDEYYERQQQDEQHDDEQQETGLDASRSRKKFQQQQKRLVALQCRRICRDEAYFRSTLVELYQHQLRTLDEYYVQKTIEEEEYDWDEDYYLDGSFDSDDDDDSSSSTSSSSSSSSSSSPEGKDENGKKIKKNSSPSPKSSSCYYSGNIIDESLESLQKRRRKMRRAVKARRRRNRFMSKSGGGGPSDNGGNDINSPDRNNSNNNNNINRRLNRRRNHRNNNMIINNSKTGGDQRSRLSALATLCPKSFQGFAVGFLMVLFAGSSAFFFMATFFYLMGTSAIVVAMFLAIFSDLSDDLPAAYIFPMGLGILLVAHQGVLVASRGFELASQTLRGELILPFRWLAQKLGKRYGVGLLLQFLLFFSIALAQLTLFIVAAVNDPTLGLQQLFAVGLYCAGVVIMIVHALFPFGFDPEEEETTRLARSRDMGDGGGGGGGGSTKIGLSVYFFFDIYENLDDEQASYDASGQKRPDQQGNVLPTSSLVLAIFPALLSFIFGLFFIVEQRAFFLITAVVVTLGAGFTLTHFIAGRLKTLTANLSRSAIWSGVLIWLFVFFGFGMVPQVRDQDARYHQNWLACIISLFALWCFLAFFSSAANRLGEATKFHQFSFRAGYGIIVILILAGIVTLFIVHWILGLFSLIFLFHSLACFYKPNSHSPTASLILSIIICLVLVAIILFATNSSTHDFDLDKIAVLRSGNISSLSANESTLFSSYYTADSSQNNYQSEYFSLCQRVWHFADSASSSSSSSSSASKNSITLRLPDFALFIKLAYHSGLTNERLQRLLPQWKLATHAKAVGHQQHQYVLYDAFQDVNNNNTIISVRTSGALLPRIKVVSMWTEAISLLPFVTILPVDWTASVIGGVSDVNRLFDPFGRKVIDDLVEEVRNHMMNLQQQQQQETEGNNNNSSTKSNNSSSSTSKRETILIGHSVGGSIAAAAATRLGLRAVIFSAPGLHYSKEKFGIDSTVYERQVLNIRTSNDAVSVVDTYGPNQQVLTCKEGVASCSSIDFPLCLLSNLCSQGVNGNLSLSICK